MTHEGDLSDEDDGRYDNYQAHGYSRKNVYDSRVEQILYENLDLPILITDAGKNHEGGGSFIVYTIRTGVCSSCLGSVDYCSGGWDGLIS